MSRWIDADALIRYGKRGTLVYWEDIEDAPSIDIVRCRECKYWRAYETWSECERWTDDPYESAKTKADDFCSYGEREGE
jgi:hypothetical protein